jgi:hypothetical protein
MAHVYWRMAGRVASILARLMGALARFLDGWVWR